MSKRLRETVADWLMVLAGPLLLLSLFLAWSHQFSRSFWARYGGSAVVAGIPRDPDAWQVYSTADVLLALVAAGLMVVALWGGRARRLALAAGLVVALAFTAHAIAVAPTNGAVVYDPTGTPPDYVPNGAVPGVGETLALVALVMGAAGVALSYSVER